MLWNRTCGAIIHMTENKETSRVIKVHKCPICGKLTDSLEYRPFCSKRCSDIDLGNWFNEGYVIEGKAPIDEEESE